MMRRTPRVIFAAAGASTHRHPEADALARLGWPVRTIDLALNATAPPPATATGAFGNDVDILIVRSLEGLIAQAPLLGTVTASACLIAPADPVPGWENTAIKIRVADTLARRLSRLAPLWCPATDDFRDQLALAPKGLSIAQADWPLLVRPAPVPTTECGEHWPRRLGLLALAPGEPTPAHDRLVAIAAQLGLAVRCLVREEAQASTLARWAGAAAVFTRQEVSTDWFLGGIDILHAAGTMAHRRAVRELLAAAPCYGVIPVTDPAAPPDIAALAAMAEDNDPAQILARLVEERAFRTARLRTARRQADAIAGPRVFARRIAVMAGHRTPPPLADVAAWRGRVGALVARSRPATARRPRLAIVSSNGIGLGHVARSLAIASACRPRADVTIVTLSAALPAIMPFGFRVEHVPTAEYLAVTEAAWNRYLADALTDLAERNGIDILIYDGNRLHDGLVRAAQALDARLVWVRRGLWQAHHAARHLEVERYCDRVIVPGDLAADRDRGPTADNLRAPTADTLTVPPILVAPPQGRLDRQAARRDLSLDGDQPAALVQLGAGTLVDQDDVLDGVLDGLEARDVRAMVALWPMPDPGIDRVRRHLAAREIAVVDRFPLARWHAAFDFTVASAGYNVFHEAVAARLPAAFLPVRAAALDDQSARAAHAEQTGFGLWIREDDQASLPQALDRLVDPNTRERLAANMPALDPMAGAVAAGDAILATTQPPRPIRATNRMLEASP